LLPVNQRDEALAPELTIARTEATRELVIVIDERRLANAAEAVNKEEKALLARRAALASPHSLAENGAKTIDLVFTRQKYVRSVFGLVRRRHVVILV